MIHMIFENKIRFDGQAHGPPDSRTPLTEWSSNLNFTRKLKASSLLRKYAVAYVQWNLWT